MRLVGVTRIRLGCPRSVKGGLRQTKTASRILLLRFAGLFLSAPGARAQHEKAEPIHRRQRLVFSFRDVTFAEASLSRVAPTRIDRQSQIQHRRGIRSQVGVGWIRGIVVAPI